MLHTIEESIQVEAPVAAAYNQWTRFEEFPQFMEGIEDVRQQGDRRLHWRGRIGTDELEWDAEITEQLPDKRIAWRNRSGPTSGGVVTFHRVAEGVTRVMLQMDYEPGGVPEEVGAWLGVLDRRVRGDLARFKERVEHLGDRGGWRGTISSKEDAPT